MGRKRYWNPLKSTVEKVPNTLVVSHEQPGIMATAHWHAQVEINYVFRGTVDYRMHGHLTRLAAGDLCMFWGGLPHRVFDTSEDAFFIAVHLPLIHFFRLRLADDVRHRLMHGATLIIAASDSVDQAQFVRWAEFIRSDDRGKREHAVDELLLRIERVRFEPFRLVGGGGGPAAAEDGPSADQHSFRSIGRICSFIAENFRQDIAAADIALSADIHPKYAMSVFKKSTGMTLSAYVNLLRLSYAQALLMSEEENVLRVAMESGFGSLSAFNNSFRKFSGMSPSRFRRGLRSRITLGAAVGGEPK